MVYVPRRRAACHGGAFSKSGKAHMHPVSDVPGLRLVGSLMLFNSRDQSSRAHRGHRVHRGTADTAAWAPSPRRAAGTWAGKDRADRRPADKDWADTRRAAPLPEKPEPAGPDTRWVGPQAARARPYPAWAAEAGRLVRGQASPKSVPAMPAGAKVEYSWRADYTISCTAAKGQFCDCRLAAACHGGSFSMR